MSEQQQRNIFNQPLQECGCKPMTGFFRDGSCRTDGYDTGIHTVCAVMTTDFLAYTRAQGNDLSTPRPEYDFPGLKAGDRWCVCAGRWLEAAKANIIAPVVLDATHEETLAIIPLALLKSAAFQ